MNIETLLKTAVADAFDTHFGQRPDENSIQLQKTRTGYEGSVTVVVFPLVKLA